MGKWEALINPWYMLASYRVGRAHLVPSARHPGVVMLLPDRPRGVVSGQVVGGAVGDALVANVVVVMRIDGVGQMGRRSVGKIRERMETTARR